MGDIAPAHGLKDPARVAMRDEKLWRREKAMYAQHCMKLMPCPCKVCKGSKKHMAIDTVENHLMQNGRHHSFRRWRGPGARDESDGEWDDHVRSNGGTLPRLPMDENVGLQRLFQNINAIPPANTEAVYGTQGAVPDEQPSVGNMPHNREDIELEDHVMEVVQQTQNIVENVQAVADSMEEHSQAMADSSAQSPTNLDATATATDGESTPTGTPLDVAEDLNLADVLLSCHPLFVGAFVTKLAATMLIMTICTVHGVNNKFVDELLNLLHKYILPHPNSLPSNMYHAKVLVEKVSHSYESIHACKNGCVLFRGDAHKDLSECPVCDASRFKAHGKSQVPVSVLRHFPLIPRLVRWYKSPRIAQMLNWAHSNKSNDGKMHQYL